MSRRLSSWLPFFLLPLALSLSACSGCAPDVVGNDGGGSSGIGDGGGKPLADGGRDDGGAPDAGPGEDSGTSDAGEDAGAPDDAGSSDAGSSDAGSSGADGGSDDAGAIDAGPTCTGDSDCALGELCVGGDCVPGCTDGRDCPDARPLCDPDLGANGTCVVCLVNTDCPSAGDVCLEGECRAGCSADNPACPSPGVCDTAAGVCVRCLADSDCDLGNICEMSDCVEGCRENRDCPEGQICGADNTCVTGCTAAPTDSCPLGTHCVSGGCVLGCNGDDARCGDGQVCVDEGGSFVCRDGCADNAACGAGRICLNDVCVEGCAVDEDCGFLTLERVCDTSAGVPGTCVQCTNDDQCPGDAVCDLLAGSCRILCSSTGQFGCGTLGLVCDVATDRCVPCLEDADCGPAATCDTARHECVAELCGECGDDADCTGDGSLCVRRSFGLLANESACGVDCSATPCPQGYACVFVGEPVVRGQQCVPTSTVVEEPTCAAIRDLEGSKACSGGFQCGLTGLGDGVCVGASPGQQGQCSIPCANVGDCPATYTCEAPPQGAPPEATGVCAPVQ